MHTSAPFGIGGKLFPRSSARQGYATGRGHDVGVVAVVLARARGVWPRPQSVVGGGHGVGVVAEMDAEEEEVKGVVLSEEPAPRLPRPPPEPSEACRAYHSARPRGDGHRCRLGAGVCAGRGHAGGRRCRQRRRGRAASGRRRRGIADVRAGAAVAARAEAVGRRAALDRSLGQAGAKENSGGLLSEQLSLPARNWSRR
jgi:hypothetical protein